jgi:hypothetical protein
MGDPSFTIGFLVIDPSNPSNLYGGSSNGMFKSSDGGTSWMAMNTGLANPLIQSLTMDPTDSSTLYAGTTSGGVFKTTNSSASWQATGANFGGGSSPASAISRVTGDGQRGAAGQSLGRPFVTVVTNGSGIPVQGVIVTFSVQSGGGTLSNTQTVTDSQGVATTTLVLGSRAGVNTVSAAATGLSGSPVTFTATGLKKARGQLVTQ